MCVVGPVYGRGGVSVTTKVGLVVCRVGQNRIFTFIYTVYLVISKPKIPYVHRICMVLADPSCV